MIEARIVGVVRSPWFSDYGDLGPRHASCPRRGSSPSTARSSSGRWGSAYVNALVRLEGGGDAVPAFREELAEVTGRRDIEFFDLVGDARHVHDVARFEADALLVFAAAAGIAALFLVGQSIVRYVAAATAELEVLRSVGMRPRHVRTMAAVGPTLAAVVGGAVGAVGAFARLGPVPGRHRGAVRARSRAPGRCRGARRSASRWSWCSWSVGALTASWLAGRSYAHASSGRPSRLAAIPAAPRRPGAGGDRGPASRSSAGAGRSPCPCSRRWSARWSAWWASSAALTFADGIDDATSHPERFGMYAELETFFGFNGEDFVPADDLITALAAVDGVAAVNDNRSGVAEAGSVDVTTFTLDPGRRRHRRSS